MSYWTSARCFAPLRFAPAVHRAALGPLGPEVRGRPDVGRGRYVGLVDALGVAAAVAAKIAPGVGGGPCSTLTRASWPHASHLAVTAWGRRCRAMFAGVMGVARAVTLAVVTTFFRRDYAASGGGRPARAPWSGASRFPPAKYTPPG